MSCLHDWFKVNHVTFIDFSNWSSTCNLAFSRTLVLQSRQSLQVISHTVLSEFMVKHVVLLKLIKVLLGMTSDLSTSSRAANVTLDFLPVLAKQLQTSQELRVLIFSPSTLELNSIYKRSFKLRRLTKLWSSSAKDLTCITFLWFLRRDLYTLS
jgi:hypothetical protein